MTSETLWYANRATGAVCLVLFTVVVLLGIAVRLRARIPGLPRFGTVTLHRTLSLCALVFLVLHITTAIVDSYVDITVADVLVPFVSEYQPLWLGLGTDTGTDWMTWLTITCVAAVLTVGGIRVAHSARAARRTPAALLRAAEGARP